MLSLKAPLLLGVLAASALPGMSRPWAPCAQDAQGTGGSEGVRELELVETPGTRVEYFRVDLAPEARPAGEPDRGVPLGLARWVRGPLDAVSHGWRTECEILFPAQRTRVQHTERLTPGLRELVFREVRSFSGRTVYLAWSADGTATSTETVGGEVLRRDLDVTPGGMPLSLVELARRGRAWEGELDVFRPLSNALEPWTSSLVAAEGGLRLDVRGPEGVLAGSYTFEGERLVSFRWHVGGLVASAVPADEYERWAQAMRVDALEPPALATRQQVLNAR